ncbi:F-box/WD repeat-containing protein 10-like [Patagioenas fasciata]|uniref:F-box/WD repeat-containing protein 10-like n=1 Tax=Patagioenas fasciata TaxID=372321 RepID=UPI0032E876FE
MQRRTRLLCPLTGRDEAVGPAAHRSPSNVFGYKNLISCLPLHLSLYIFGLLDEKSLEACASVNRFWAHLVEEVNKERECQKIIQESILYLQGLCPRRAVPTYAKRVDVTVPVLNEEGDVIEGHDCESKPQRGERREEKDNLQEAYRDLKTDTIQLEERNVFCGSYSVRVLMDQSDQSRIIHYSGGDLVAVGSASRKVRFLGMPGTKEVPPLLSGSAGSKALLLDENKGLVLSTGFDLSIRCWNIYSGACVKVFDGHRGTVTCLDLHEEQLVSGARDGMVKVWNLRSGRCLQTLQHSSAVWVVRTDGARVVSGCERGLVRVWAADTGALIKTLEEHQGPVKCLSFDQWHLVTGSTDGSALGWSMLGKLSRCLVAFHHPKEVVSLQLLYLRVISGCADGNIRIFNYLTGTCLKVLTADTSGGPISSVHVSENRMVINSPAVVLVFQFEDVSWDYTLDAAREVAGKTNQQQATWSRTAVPCWRRLYHDRMRRLALEPEALGKKPMKSAACQQHPHLLKMKQSSHVQAEQRNKLCGPDTTQPRALTSGKLARARSRGFPADIPGSRLQHGPPINVPAHLDKAESTWQFGKRRGESGPMSVDKFLLTLNTLQNARKAAALRYPVHRHAEVREVCESEQHHPEKVQIHKPSLQRKNDQAAQLQRAKLHSDSLTPRVISVPFETKMLQLKLKNSLHGPTVKSSIPAPSVVRLKTCSGLLKEKKAPGEVIPPPGDAVQVVDPVTAAAERTKPTHATIAQTGNKEVSRRKISFCTSAADPSQPNGGFRLLTEKWKERCEAAVAAQCKAEQQLTEERERARRKAWLRKAKGLPVDSFTGEGKIPAPELGFNTFI